MPKKRQMIRTSVHVLTALIVLAVVSWAGRLCREVRAADTGEHQTHDVSKTTPPAVEEAPSGHAGHGGGVVNQEVGQMKHGAVHGEGAHDMADTGGKAPVHVHQAPDETELFNSVGVDEKLGSRVSPDIRFKDSRGESVKLGDLLDRPVLLQLVFYRCPQACNLMMASLARILDGVTFDPGKEYRVVTISFDTDDTPAIAADTKFNYLKLLKEDFPEDQWYYLTGDVDAVRAVTESVGFRFKKTGQHNFVHPNVLTVLGEGGKIIRYLYGVDYLPFDVSMGIAEATRGTPATSIKKLLTYCFDYDPKGKKYVFKSFQAAAVGILLLLGGLFYLLLRKGNR